MEFQGSCFEKSRVCGLKSIDCVKRFYYLFFCFSVKFVSIRRIKKIKEMKLCAHALATTAFPWRVVRGREHRTKKKKKKRKKITQKICLLLIVIACVLSSLSLSRFSLPSLLSFPPTSLFSPLLTWSVYLIVLVVVLRADMSVLSAKFPGKLLLHCRPFWHWV